MLSAPRSLEPAELATGMVIQYQTSERLWHDANPILGPVLAAG